MKISEENKYELIDKYVGGHMSQEESMRFLSIIENNEDLTTEFNLIKELHLLEDFSVKEKDLKETLKSFKSQKVNPKRILALTALILFFGAMALYLFNTIDHQKSDLSQVQMAMLEPLELTTKSNDNQQNLRLMQDFYNNQDYKKALPYISDYLDSNPSDLDVLLAKGISLIKTDKLKEAHLIFDKIEGLNPRVKKYKYYRAFIFVKEGNQEKAVPVLKDIIENKYYAHEKAKVLLDFLN